MKFTHACGHEVEIEDRRMTRSVEVWRAAVGSMPCLACREAAEDTRRDYLANEMILPPPIMLFPAPLRGKKPTVKGGHGVWQQLAEKPEDLN